MTTSTLARPGRRPGALVAVALDPRPCVVNPPQWWDVGDDGNAAALWLCRKRCPLRDQCEPQAGTIRGGTAWGGSDYAKDPKPLKMCDDCGHPRVRELGNSPLVCKCPGSGRTRRQVVQAWLDAGGPNRTIAAIAAEIGIHPDALKDTLRRARNDGDTRIPLLHSPHKRRAA